MNNQVFLKNITLDGEEWRDVIGFEGLYKVSSYGRVCLWKDTQTIVSRTFISNHTCLLQVMRKVRKRQVSLFQRKASKARDIFHISLLKTFSPSQTIIMSLIQRMVTSTTAKLIIFIGEERSKHANFTIPLHLKVKHGRQCKDMKACTKYLL